MNTLKKWNRSELAKELNELRNLRHSLRRQISMMTFNHRSSSWFQVKLNELNLKIEEFKNRG